MNNWSGPESAISAPHPVGGCCGRVFYHYWTASLLVRSGVVLPDLRLLENMSQMDVLLSLRSGPVLDGSLGTDVNGKHQDGLLQYFCCQRRLAASLLSCRCCSEFLAWSVNNPLMDRKLNKAKTSVYFCLFVFTDWSLIRMQVVLCKFLVILVLVRYASRCELNSGSDN